jgi:hypothetical protein
MATQAEINQQLGTWAANFLLLMTKKKFYSTGSRTSLDKWFNTYIKPLYTQIGTANITLPNFSEVENCPRRDKGPARALSTKYGNALIKDMRALQSQLPGILNMLSIANAGTIMAAFNKIGIGLDSKDVGCGKGFKN